MPVSQSDEVTPKSRRGRVDALVVTGALAANNVASYALTVIAARLLVPAAFGELGSLLAVLVIGAVPALAVQTVVALRVAGDPRGRSLTALGLVAGAAVTVLVLLCTPLFVALLHLDGPWPVVFLALALGPITLNGLWYGTLQGGRRFRAMSAQLVFEAVGRIGGTLLGLAATRTPAGALAGAAAGSLLVALSGWLLCGRPGLVRLDRGQVRDVLHAGQALLALVLLVNLDLVLARHTLPADQAGEYAVGAVITKIAYWLPYAIAIVVLPRLADGADRRRVVPRALALCAAMDAAVVLGAALFGPLGVSLVGGAAYAGSSIPLWPFALVGSMLSLVQILLFSRIASADRWSTLLTWLAVVVETGLVLVFLHGGLTRIVTAAVVATGLLVTAGALVEWRSRG